MVDEATLTTFAAITVTVSFPFYLCGAWVMIDTEMVSWDVLAYHLKIISSELVLNTVPVVMWMLPRLFQQFNRFSTLHTTLGLQAYATLIFALTGIIRIPRVKWEANLCRNPDQDVSLGDLHENTSVWRGRLHVDVFGYVIFWVFTRLLGIYCYLSGYVFG